MEGLYQLWSWSIWLAAPTKNFKDFKSTYLCKARVCFPHQSQNYKRWCARNVKLSLSLTSHVIVKFFPNKLIVLLANENSTNNHDVIKIYKTDFFFSITMQINPAVNCSQKSGQKLRFPINVFGPRSLFETTAVATWWPSERIQIWETSSVTSMAKRCFYFLNWSLFDDESQGCWQFHFIVSLKITQIKLVWNKWLQVLLSSESLQVCQQTVVSVKSVGF